MKSDRLKRFMAETYLVKTTIGMNPTISMSYINWVISRSVLLCPYRNALEDALRQDETVEV